MAASSAHKAAREKAKKQKKMLLLLMLPLGLSGFYAYHTLAKAHSSSAPPPAATTTSTSTTPTAPGSATASAVPAVSAAVLQAADGKLTSLVLLPSRDPFSGAVGQSSPSVPPAASSPPPSTSTPKHVKSQPVKSQPVKSQPKKSQPVSPEQQKPQKKKLSPPPKTAILAYDGMLIKIRLHKTFGEAPSVGSDPPQPLFWVVTLTQKTARIVVVGIQGAKTLKVDVPMSLSDLNGTSHTLMLLPQGTPLPPPPGVATASTTSTTGSRGG